MREELRQEQASILASAEQRVAELTRTEQDAREKAFVFIPN